MSYAPPQVSRLIALACWLAAPCVLAGADKIVILAADSAVHQQLVDTLCVSQECIPSERVLTAGKVDYAKAARQKVQAVVLGRLSKSGASCSLEVSVRGKTGALRMSRTVPAESSGKVSIVDVIAAGAQAISVIERPESQDPKLSQPKAKKVAAKKRSKKSSRKVAEHRGGRGNRG